MVSRRASGVKGLCTKPATLPRSRSARVAEPSVDTTTIGMSASAGCWRQWGEITPLVATIAYLVIGLSVSGMDGVCGILVGLGFLGRGGAPRFIARHGVLRPQQEMPLAEARGSENGR